MRSMGCSVARTGYRDLANVFPKLVHVRFAGVSHPWHSNGFASCKCIRTAAAGVHFFLPKCLMKGCEQLMLAVIVRALMQIASTGGLPDCQRSYRTWRSPVMVWIVLIAVFKADEQVGQA